MSLNFTNNIASSKPVIREAANMQNDGGGGNLGYMMQGRREDEERKHNLDKSIFAQEKDVFGARELDMPEEGFSLAKFVAQVILAVKSLFVKK
ncbi:MAG: hypothetical protein LBK53_08930 [Heliobacteriaceae bacterium]|jgi:hypothetical protein|nr:hypothetical protein [Heliobacteriaceae bacterium]